MAVLFISWWARAQGAWGIASWKASPDLKAEALRGARVYEERDRQEARRGRVQHITRGREHALRRREREALEMVREHFGDLRDLTVLDLGCGFGRLLGAFRAAGVPAKNLVGVDLVKPRIEAAAARFPGIRFIHGNAAELDLGGRTFDVVAMFTLVSSVRNDALATRIAGAVDTVLAPGGAILWYDVRYPKPWEAHIRTMTKRRIQAIFPGFRLDLRSRTLLPPIADRLGIATPVVYPLLAAVPFMRTHYLGLLTRIEERDGI